MAAALRIGLLALLTVEPAYGYRLGRRFESMTGSAWPLNAGQVYLTLARLERDGLAVVRHTDAEGHKIFASTAAGREEVRQWFLTPTERHRPRRDELTIKLALGAQRA